MNKPRYWLSRLQTACWAGVNALIVVCRPDGLSAKALIDSGPLGPFSLWALLVLCTICIADVLVNDLLPERFHLNTIHYRHFGLLAISVFLVLIAGVIASKDGITPLLLAWIGPAVFAAPLAFLDMFARHRPAQRTMA